MEEWVFVEFVFEVQYYIANITLLHTFFYAILPAGKEAHENKIAGMKTRMKKMDAKHIHKKKQKKLETYIGGNCINDQCLWCISLMLQIVCHLRPLQQLSVIWPDLSITNKNIEMRTALKLNRYKRPFEKLFAEYVFADDEAFRRDLFWRMLEI